MNRTISILLILILVSIPAYAGLGSKKTKYVGGTISQLKEGVQGKSSVQDEHDFIFRYKKHEFRIPYDKIIELEYGQKAGRRVGVAIALTPWALFSKKRKHYLTITYIDEFEHQQAGVFELGKKVIRVMLAGLQARTGKKIIYQDDEARKSGKGN